MKKIHSFADYSQDLIRTIQDIQDEPVGGKAKGLQMLRSMGLRVPDAFVLIHPDRESIHADGLELILEKLGPGPKAVRSSAVSEDGTSASFAGQFETFLNLEGYTEIRQAVIRCIEAAGSGRVRSYSDNLLNDADLRISVIIQNMVQARVSGVVFTANPVNHRRDLLVVNAVAGPGEDLVSGAADAHHYEIFPSQSNLRQEAGKNGRLLDEQHLREIVAGATLAEQRIGRPVDLEWAIDHEGHLHWLQVRPITTLDGVHFNELDTIQGATSDIFTLGNIGEMMPGVVTPLTATVSAEAIDYGMTILADRSGAFRLRERTGPRYIQMFYNRLFINMSHMMDYPKHVWLNKPEDVQFALSGKVFGDIEAKPVIPLPWMVFNFFRQMFNTGRAGHYLRKLRNLAAGFSVATSGTTRELYENLAAARLTLGIGFGHHLGTSAQSGTLYSAFMRIMTSDKRKPEAADHHIATMLLLNIPEIESADAVKSLDRFATQIRADVRFSGTFVEATPDEALHLLRHSAPPAIRDSFRAFMDRHGHRCVRESELREKTWEENPGQLIKILQSRVKLGRVQPHITGGRMQTNEALAHLPPIKRFILKMMIPTARKAVARREISKALSIKMVDVMRRGYKELALRLVREGLLDDTDQVFFLTQDELGLLIDGRGEGWRSVANRRRTLLPATGSLIFEEISFGKPEPLDQEVVIEITGNRLKGTPVSQGIAEGKARIVHSLSDAEKLHEGDIMVASFTDIGWTPWFSIISGLITEIGSPLSHGAVVAREYGIPAIVAAKGAKQFLKDGDLVRLDGNLGIVEKIEQKECAE